MPQRCTGQWTVPGESSTLTGRLLSLNSQGRRGRSKPVMFRGDKLDVAPHKALADGVRFRAARPQRKRDSLGCPREVLHDRAIGPRRSRGSWLSHGGYCSRARGSETIGLCDGATPGSRDRRGPNRDLLWCLVVSRVPGRAPSVWVRPHHTELSRRTQCGDGTLRNESARVGPTGSRSGPDRPYQRACGLRLGMAPITTAFRDRSLSGVCSRRGRASTERVGRGWVPGTPSAPPLPAPPPFLML